MFSLHFFLAYRSDANFYRMNRRKADFKFVYKYLEDEL